MHICLAEAIMKVLIGSRSVLGSSRHRRGLVARNAPTGELVRRIGRDRIPSPRDRRAGQYPGSGTPEGVTVERHPRAATRANRSPRRNACIHAPNSRDVAWFSDVAAAVRPHKRSIWRVARIGPWAVSIAATASGRRVAARSRRSMLAQDPDLQATTLVLDGSGPSRPMSGRSSGSESTSPVRALSGEQLPAKSDHRSQRPARRRERHPFARGDIRRRPRSNIWRSKVKQSISGSASKATDRPKRPGSPLPDRRRNQTKKSSESPRTGERHPAWAKSTSCGRSQWRRPPLTTTSLALPRRFVAGRAVTAIVAARSVKFDLH